MAKAEDKEAEQPHGDEQLADLRHAKLEPRTHVLGSEGAIWGGVDVGTDRYRRGEGVDITDIRLVVPSCVCSWCSCVGVLLTMYAFDRVTVTIPTTTRLSFIRSRATTRRSTPSRRRRRSLLRRRTARSP